MTDRGLYLRMGLAVLLVTLLPVAFVYVLLELLNSVGLWSLRMATGNVWAGELYLRWWLGLAVVVGFAAQRLFGESLALRAVRASRVTAAERPGLVGWIDRLSQSADVASPTVAVAESEVPNSFVVGRGPSSTTLVVSEGLLATLGDVELDAVIAHELAHVKNRDASVLSLAYLLPILTYALAVGASALLRAIPGSLRWFGSVDRNSGRAQFLAIAVLVVSGVLTFAVSVASKPCI